MTQVYIRINVEGVSRLRRDLRRFAPEVGKQFHRRLRSIAKDAADDAKLRASWSTKIPGGIGYGDAARGPYISYRGSAPEIGRLNEQRTEWRHPLFGNREHWYEQRGRAFLQPAADAKQEEIDRQMLEAVDAAQAEVDLL